MVKLIVRGIFGLLDFEEKLLQHRTKAFEVQQKESYRDVVIDGEVVSLSMPLQFTFEEKALKVLVPVKKES